MQTSNLYTQVPNSTFYCLPPENIIFVPPTPLGVFGNQFNQTCALSNIIVQRTEGAHSLNSSVVPFLLRVSPESDHSKPEVATKNVKTSLTELYDFSSVPSILGVPVQNVRTPFSWSDDSGMNAKNFDCEYNSVSARINKEINDSPFRLRSKTSKKAVASSTSKSKLSGSNVDKEWNRMSINIKKRRKKKENAGSSYLLRSKASKESVVDRESNQVTVDVKKETVATNSPPAPTKNVNCLSGGLNFAEIGVNSFAKVLNHESVSVNDETSDPFYILPCKIDAVHSSSSVINYSTSDVEKFGKEINKAVIPSEIEDPCEVSFEVSPQNTYLSSGTGGADAGNLVQELLVIKEEISTESDDPPPNEASPENMNCFIGGNDLISDIKLQDHSSVSAGAGISFDSNRPLANEQEDPNIIEISDSSSVPHSRTYSVTDTQQLLDSVGNAYTSCEVIEIDYESDCFVVDIKPKNQFSCDVVEIDDQSSCSSGDVKPESQFMSPKMQSLVVSSNNTQCFSDKLDNSPSSFLEKPRPLRKSIPRSVKNRVHVGDNYQQIKRVGNIRKSLNTTTNSPVVKSAELGKMATSQKNGRLLDAGVNKISGRKKVWKKRDIQNDVLRGVAKGTIKHILSSESARLRTSVSEQHREEETLIVKVANATVRCPKKKRSYVSEIKDARNNLAHCKVSNVNIKCSQKKSLKVWEMRDSNNNVMRGINNNTLQRLLSNPCIKSSSKNQSPQLSDVKFSENLKIPITSQQTVSADDCKAESTSCSSDSSFFPTVFDENAVYSVCIAEDLVKERDFDDAIKLLSVKRQNSLFRRRNPSAKFLEPLYKYLKDNKCLLCDFKSQSSDVYTTRKNLMSHLGSKHFCCKECGGWFSSSQSLRIHKKGHAAADIRSIIPKFTCTKCSKTFTSRSGFYTHRRKYHRPGKTFCCAICKCRFLSMYTLKQHCQKHREYVCSVCKKTFHKRKLLKDHTVEHDARVDHSDNMLCYCHLCGESYSNLVLLTKHMECHKNLSERERSACQETFSEQSQLTKHTLLHTTNARPYVCENCGLKFRSSVRLKSHQESHH